MDMALVSHPPTSSTSVNGREYTDVGIMIVEPGYKPDKPAAHHTISARRTRIGTLWALRSKMIGAAYMVVLAVSGYSK